MTWLRPGPAHHRPEPGDCCCCCCCSGLETQPGAAAESSANLRSHSLKTFCFVVAVAAATVAGVAVGWQNFGTGS